MNKKLILSAVSILLVFATVFAFAGCDNSADTETTTVITAKNALPTDITTSYDESSNLITDTTYSPEDLQANTVQIFNYINAKMNALKTGVEAKVKMSQSKGIGDASEFVYLTDEEVANLVKEALAEFVGEADERIAEANEDIAKAEKRGDAEAKQKAEEEKAKAEAEKKAVADFNGKNFDILTDEQYKIVEGYAQSKNITITFYPGNVVKVKRRDGIPMTGVKNPQTGEYENTNEYIEATIKSLDGYMLHTDGYETDDYVNVADYLPLAGQANVWNLTIDDIKSATCVDADGQRTITITLKGHEFEDIIENEIIAKAYNVETVKNGEILRIEETIGEANGRIDDANKRIEDADKAIAKAEKRNDTEALEQAKADKAKAEADKTKAEADKAAAEKLLRDTLSLKTIDENVADIMQEFDSADKYLDITKNPVLQYKDCQIIITMNLETEEIHTIQYKKSVDVSTEVTGRGSLAEIGAVPVNFNYNSTVTYNLEREVKEEATTAA